MILRGHLNNPIRIETVTEKGACAGAMIGLGVPAFRAQYQMPAYRKHTLKQIEISNYEYLVGLSSLKKPSREHGYRKGRAGGGPGSQP